MASYSRVVFLLDGTRVVKICCGLVLLCIFCFLADGILRKVLPLSSLDFKYDCLGGPGLCPRSQKPGVPSQNRKKSNFLRICFRCIFENILKVIKVTTTPSCGGCPLGVVELVFFVVNCRGCSHCRHLVRTPQGLWVKQETVALESQDLTCTVPTWVKKCQE